MAVTRASKLILLTNLLKGGTFALSTNKIIKFTASGSNTLITYFSQSGKIVTKVVTESVSTIHTATLSNTLYASQACTVVSSGAVVYLMSDRMIYIDTLTATFLITYDEGSEAGLAPSQYEISTPTAINLNTANGNTFIITQQALRGGVIPSRTRYINNLFVDMVVTEDIGTAAVLQLAMRPESYTVTAAGSGFTSLPIVAVTGGGGTGATATTTAKIISGVIAAAGTGYAPADTVTLTGGTFSTASILNVATTKVVTLATNAPGTGYAVGNVLTMVGGTFAPAATLTVSHTQAITAVVAAGGGSGTPGAVTITGTTGTGTKFQATGVIDGGGILSGALVVTIAGDYTVDPTNIAAEPVTGGSLVGATVTLVLGVLTAGVTTGGSYTANSATFTSTGAGTGATFNTVAYGVNTLTVNTAGSYTVIPTNPAAQGATSGGGTGVTVTGSYGVNTIVLGANGTGYTSMPTVTITGGTGATGVAVMEGDLINVISGGSGYTTAPTITFTGGGGTLLAATTTISLASETVTAGTVTVRGGSYTSFPTLVLAGGTGCRVSYDEKQVEFFGIQVAESVATVIAAVAAL